MLGALFRIGLAAEEARNREVALRLLRFMGLEAKAEELAGQALVWAAEAAGVGLLSGYRRQILLLDEPVAGVHPEIIQQILGLRDASVPLLLLLTRQLAIIRYQGLSEGDADAAPVESGRRLSTRR